MKTKQSLKQDKTLLNFYGEPLGKYGIEVKETGKMIGTIDLRVNETNNIGELGYVLNRAFGAMATCLKPRRR